MAAAEDCAQYKLQCVDYIQPDDEVMRPIVLFAETIAERSRQTGIERTSVGDKARRFVMEGMLGLVDHRVGQAGRKGHVSPEAVAAYMLSVKQLYPPIHDRDVVRILQQNFGYHTNHHTVRRFFARHALPGQLELQLPVFAAFAEAYQARWTVVRRWYAGWNKQSSAGWLQLSRTHVSTLREAFARDGFAGLEEQRTRPPQHPGNPLTLPFLQEVLDIQREYPRAGRLRVHGLLETRREEAPPSEATVGRAMALNRQFHGAPGPWASAQEEAPSETTPKHLPYRPRSRHHMWFIDIRSLVRLDGGWGYRRCMLEGYSRKLLAGMASPHQDLTAVLQLLCAALAEYGCPTMVIADHGAVFRAHDYTAILRALEIEPTYIERRKPWQNLIEAQFTVQRRLADCKCEHAQPFEEIQALHAAFLEPFKTTRHWAHQDREDGRRTPVEVLEWVRGRSVERARLHQLFGAVQFLRTVNRYGFISVQRFYSYAEQGLSRQRVAIWIDEGELRLEYPETLRARYRCAYEQRPRRLRDVRDPLVYPTVFASPQMELLELDATQWLKVQQRAAQHRTRRGAQLIEQLPLIHVGSVALLWSYMFFEGVGKHCFPHGSTVMVLPQVPCCVARGLPAKYI